MAASSEANGLKRLGRIAAAAAVAFSSCSLEALDSIKDVMARKPPYFTPARKGEMVTIRGTVSAPIFHFPDYKLLALQDGSYGTVIQVPENSRDLDSYKQGDQLEVTGTVASIAGMVTILPSQVRSLGHGTAPAPLDVRIEELLNFRHLGRLVRTEGKVVEAGVTTAGAQMYLAAGADNYKVFLPSGSGSSAPHLDFNSGDRVKVTGVALQYRTFEPYDRWFEVLINDPSHVVVTQRSPQMLPPIWLGLAALAIIALTALVIWRREKRLRLQRERLRTVYQLGEDILGASSLDIILAQIRDALPKILGVTRAHLYIYNRGNKTLDSVASRGQEPLSISLSSPPEGTSAGAVACFHYRTLLVIPDIDRSPFPISPASGQRVPKSLLFVPMLSQGEVSGVLELDQDDRARDFGADEQALAQHLGNQIGVAIRLLDQRSVQEQLFRTEKLAAVGRLISGVVNELKTPLASIQELAHRAMDKSHLVALERSIPAMAAEAQKASAIVSRLVSFAAAEGNEATPVCIGTLLRTLMEFREPDWKASGIRVRDLTVSEPLIVLGSQGQLEQAFLNLLVHAEQSLAASREKAITIRTSVLAKRLLVEIGFTAPPDPHTPQEVAAALELTRGVIVGHGGQVRLIERQGAEPRFEIELPLRARDRAFGTPALQPAARENGVKVTVLVIEHEETVQRQLMTLLAGRGCRVVPVTNADTGLELAQRMRFDLAFCSVHAPGLNWVELSERLQSRLGAFVLLSDGYDPELAADFEGENRFVVAKPVQEADINRVIQNLETPAEFKGPGAEIPQVLPER
jgi:GAF domain-containing protein/CheY-like chemotaxis protein